MGMFMGDSDPYIGSLLETLNLRFGKLPDTFPGVDELPLGRALQPFGLGRNGIRELQLVQAAVGVFAIGRPLLESLRALGMGCAWNGHINRRWFMLIQNLDNHPSNNPPLNGGQAIVKALLDHLSTAAPIDPVHFKTHPLASDNRVLIIPNDKPVHYIDQSYLTISLPMQPKPVVLPSGGAVPAPAPAPSP